MNDKRYRDLNELLLNSTESEGFLSMLPDDVRGAVGKRGGEIHTLEDLVCMSRGYMKSMEARYEK